MRSTRGESRRRASLMVYAASTENLTTVVTIRPAACPPRGRLPSQLASEKLSDEALSGGSRRHVALESASSQAVDLTHCLWIQPPLCVAGPRVIVQVVLEEKRPQSVGFQMLRREAPSGFRERHQSQAIDGLKVAVEGH